MPTSGMLVVLGFTILDHLTSIAKLVDKEAKDKDAIQDKGKREENSPEPSSCALKGTQCRFS